MLRIRLLGDLGLERDGEELPPPAGRPARALLAWLALHPGMHARSRLAARLWPEVLDQSARASLRNALTALRRTLGTAEPQALVATRERIGVGSEVWVDVRAFAALAASHRLEEALALVGGELLPGLDDDWVHDARLEHRDRTASVLARAADAADERGERDRAIERSRELVALDPLSEEAQRALIRRLAAAAGDRAAALAAYNRFRGRVRHELGLLPSKETRALVEGLRVDGSAHPAGEARVEALRLPPALARQPQSAMVGRRAELGRLREAWDRAGRGERRLALVAGEPGIGKTRLAAELARALHADGGAVLHGRAYEEPLIAYQPFVEALAPWLPHASTEHAELSRLLPGVTGDGLERPGGADPAGARFRLFQSVDALLVSASRQRPLLLVLEDLHWADTPTLLLLAHIARGPDPARLLLVGTYRAGELAPDHPLAAALAELRRERLAERIALGGLDEAEVGAMLADRTGATAPSDLARAVHRRTEGNPFFVEELLRHLAEAGALERPSADAVERLGVPEGVREVIGHRLARLGDDALRVLALASALGREFELRPLEELVEDMPRERVLEALERAVSADLVREDPDTVGRYGFAHALVRETLYAGLGATRRARVHARAAQVLERLHGDAPERLGQLAPPAGGRGARHGRPRGRVRGPGRPAALAQLAYEEAALHFEQALQALERSHRPHGLRRCELLLALGDARMRAGETERGREAFAGAAAAARALGRAERLARAALGFGGIGVTIIAVDGAKVRLLEEALEALGDADSALRARLLARLAVELYYGPTRDRGESLSEADPGRAALGRWAGRSPTRSTPATWRSGGRTASTSACRSRGR